MKKFVALQVGSGDAFYLEREEASILFDGGGSRVNFPRLFKNQLNQTHVNIIVCSHNDSDHTSGIIGYLKSSHTFNEIWLPASWTARIDTLLLDSEQFFEELLRDFLQLKNTKYLENTICSDTFENLNELDMEHLIGQTGEYFTMPKNCFTRRQNKTFMTLLTMANRIREITTLAYKSKKIVRWFQYSKTVPALGGESFLKPINCFELTQFHSKKMSALEYLYLSQANEESLVFYSPKVDAVADGVLFSADSDYSFSQSNPIDLGFHPIITVPHHGSKANEKGYSSKYLSQFLNHKNTVFVRSDGCPKAKCRPGPMYISFTNSKYCIRCNNCKLQQNQQSVVLLPMNRLWKSHSHICKCV